jgi:hypothetical protein
MLMLAACLVGWSSLSGCAVLSIPSYRAGHSSAPDWNQPGHLLPEHTSVESCDAGSCTQGTCDMAECADGNYEPVFPTIPMPKCIERWKEHKNLPEGPNGLRFHPLPTRPMFTPRPATQAMAAGQVGAGLQSSVAEPLGNSTYGKIPRGAQWTESTEPTGSLQPGESPNAAEVKLPDSKEPTIEPQINESSSIKTDAEELPAPAIK